MLSMKILTIVFLFLSALSLPAQKQTLADFAATCPCTLQVKQKANISDYSCNHFPFYATYKVEVERFPLGIPDDLSEKEHLQSYYLDLLQRGVSPEWVSFRDMPAVLYQVVEPLSAKQNVISDNLVFFAGGKRYTLIVTTVSGTRRTLWQDFSNSFEVK